MLQGLSCARQQEEQRRRSAGSTETLPGSHQGRPNITEGWHYDEETCPVCHDKLGSQLMVLPCGHLLCCKCKILSSSNFQDSTAFYSYVSRWLDTFVSYRLHGHHWANSNSTEWELTKVHPLSHLPATHVCGWHCVCWQRKWEEWDFYTNGPASWRSWRGSIIASQGLLWNQGKDFAISVWFQPFVAFFWTFHLPQFLLAVAHNIVFTIPLLLMTQIEAVVRRLLWLKSKDQDAKILIFSTWHDVLDVIEHAMKVNRITFARVKGTK